MTEEEKTWHKLTNHFVNIEGGPPCWASGDPMTLEDQLFVMNQMEIQRKMDEYFRNKK